MILETKNRFQIKKLLTWNVSLTQKILTALERLKKIFV